MLRSRFPTGLNITGVRLKSIACNTNPLGLRVVFERAGSVISTTLNIPTKDKFQDSSDRMRENMRITIWMESLFFVFLNAEEVLEARRDLYGTASEKFCEYINNINAMLVKKNAFDIPLCLKVVSDKMGNPSLPRYVSHNGHIYPFVKREDDVTKELKLTKYEQTCH